jgi:hypothetical protein
MSSLREAITAAAQKPPVAFVSAAHDGQTVFIRRLSGQEVGAYWVSIKDKAAGQVQQMLVQRCLADEGGAQLFTPAELAEVAKLDNAFLEEVAGEAQRVNCLTTRDVDAMRASFFEKRATAGSTSSPVISES